MRRHCARRSADSFSLHARIGAGLTQENWQILSMIGQRLTSQALSFVIGGDFQVEPKQLEDSGWVRAVGGFLVAPQLSNGHAVVSVSSIFFVVSRNLAGACEATTPSLSPHRSPQAVRILVSTRLIQPRKRVNVQAEAVASGEASWLQEAGC